VRSDISNRIYF